MGMFGFLSLVFALQSVVTSLVLTDADVQDIIYNSEKGIFVMYYLPTCGHSKKLLPVWRKLTEVFKDSDEAIIAQMSCAEGTFCNLHGVTESPTLVYYTSTHPHGEIYWGKEDIFTLKKFVRENIGRSCSSQYRKMCTPEQVGILQEADLMTDQERQVRLISAKGRIEESESRYHQAHQEWQAKRAQLEQAHYDLEGQLVPMIELFESYATDPAYSHEEL